MKNKRLFKIVKKILFFIPVILFLSCKICFSDICSVPSPQYETIQSAIDDANCSSIEIDEGTYNEQLAIGRAVSLVGSGKDTIIKPEKSKITNKYAREYGGNENTASIIAVTGGNVSLQDIRIDGSLVDDLSGLEGVDLFTGILYTIAYGDIKNVVVENINILNGVGIYLYSNEDYTVEISNSRINNFLSKGISANGYGLTANIHNNTIYGGGYIDEHQQKGIEINGSKGAVSNNYIRNLSYADFDGRAGCIFILNAVGPKDGTSDVVVSGNTLIDCQAGVVSWADGSNQYDIEVKSNVINNSNLRTLKIKNVVGINVATWSSNAEIYAIIGGSSEIDGNDLTGGGPGKAIQIGDISYNHPEGKVDALIKNNIISGFWPVWDCGIWLGIGSNEIAIDGNVLINNYNVNGQQAGAGINILQGVNVQNISVNYNVFAGNRPYGIYNGGTGVLNAENNWWNSPNGPKPTGSGDLVSANVDYEPYLTERPEKLGKADLTVAISVPSSASTNSTIKLTDKTANFGYINANASKTYFYISNDPILDTDDEKIGEREIPALPQGSKSKGTITSDTIEVAPGTYYIIAKADAENGNDEYNEHNNIAIKQIKIGLSDLVVYKLNAPNSAAPGSTVTIKYTIKNRGRGTAPQSRLRFYLSSDINLDSEDELLVEREVPSISNNSNQNTFEDSFEQDIPEGAWYYLLAKVDADDEVEEMNENNNLGYRVMAVGPDLIVSSITAPSFAYAGSTISVKDTTKNNSTTSSTISESKTKFYLSTDVTLDDDDYEFEDYHSVPVLGPGDSDTKSTSLTIPIVNPGTYYIIAKADADDDIAEYKENNNTRFKSINIK